MVKTYAATDEMEDASFDPVNMPSSSSARPSAQTAQPHLSHLGAVHACSLLPKQLLSVQSGGSAGQQRQPLMGPDAEHWELPFCKTFSQYGVEAQMDTTKKMERKETGAEGNLHRHHTRYLCIEEAH